MASKMSPPFDKKPYAIIVFIYFMQVVYLCTHTKNLKIVKLFSLFFDIKHTPWNKSFFKNNFILSWTALFTLRTSSACYCLSQCGLLIAHFDLVSELVLALNFWHLSLLSYTRLVPVCLISPVPITWLNLRVNTAIYFLSSEFGYLFTYVKLSITYG